ncbi:hypothetical protein THAOC_05304, partial [Thalassiosira oceanica]
MEVDVPRHEGDEAGPVEDSRDSRADERGRRAAGRTARERDEAAQHAAVLAGDGDGRNETVRKQRKTAAGGKKGGGDGNPSSHLVNSNPAAVRTLEMAYYECRVDPYRGLGVTEESGGDAEGEADAAMEEAEGNGSVATQPEEGSDADSDAALPDTGAASQTPARRLKPPRSLVRRLRRAGR